MIVMFAMLLGLTAFQYYRATHNPPAAPSQAAQQQQQAQTQHPEPTVAATVAGQTTNIPGVQVPVVQAEAESTTVVENELYRITFSNRGAQATSWILKNYKDADGKPLNLVHPDAAAALGYPLSLYTYDSGLTANLAKALYVPSATGPLTAPASLTYKYSAGGYDVTKTFTFDDSYVLHADTQVLRNGAPIRALISWPGGLGDQESVNAYGSMQVDYSQNGSEKHKGFKDVSGGATLLGGYDWAGVSDLYFATVFLPDAPDTATVATLNNGVVVPKPETSGGWGKLPPAPPPITSVSDLSQYAGKTQSCYSLKLPSDGLCVPMLGAALGDLSGHTQTRIFVGPKAVDVLRNLHASESEDHAGAAAGLRVLRTDRQVPVPRAAVRSTSMSRAELGLGHRAG